MRWDLFLFIIWLAAWTASIFLVVIREGQELPSVDAGTRPLQQTAWMVFCGLLAAAALYQLWLLFGGRQRRVNPAVETLPDSSTGTDGGG